MLIAIDDSVRNCLASGELEGKAVNFLEYVTMAYAEGKHAVCGSPEVLRDLSNRAPLSARARGALRSVAGRAAEANGLRRALSFHIEVGHGADFLDIVRSQPEGRVLRADVAWFDDSIAVQPAVLLAEGPDDAAIYVALGSAFVEHRGWKLKLALEQRPGGGSGLASAFGLAIREKRACLCIVDSDRRCPEGRTGDTARAVQKVSVVRGVHHVIVTGARELENVLPTQLMLHIMAEQGKHEAVAHYSRLLAINSDTVGFVDLKKGMRVRDIAGLDLSSADEMFWVEVERALLNRPELGYSRCQTFESCTRDGCTCILLPALGDTLASWARKTLTLSNGRQIARLVNFASHEDLWRICSEVAAFGCAPGRSVA